MSKKTKETEEKEPRVIKASELEKLDLSNQEPEEEIEQKTKPETEPETEPEVTIVSPRYTPEPEVESNKPQYKVVRTFKESGKIFKAGVTYTGLFTKKFLKIGFLQLRNR